MEAVVLGIANYMLDNILFSFVTTKVICNQFLQFVMQPASTGVIDEEYYRKNINHKYDDG